MRFLVILKIYLYRDNLWSYIELILRFSVNSSSLTIALLWYICMYNNDINIKNYLFIQNYAEKYLKPPQKYKFCWDIICTHYAILCSFGEQ